MTVRAMSVLLLCLLALAAVTPVRAAGCDMSLDAPQIDYGRLSRATMVAEGDDWLLPPRTVTLTVSCPEPRDMTLRFRAPADDAGEFRFTERGRLSPHLHDGVLDGEAVALGPVDESARTAVRNGAGLAWLPDQPLAPLKAGRVAMGRVFRVQLDLQARVNDSAMNGRDATSWSFDGLIEAVSADVARTLSMQASVQPGSCQVDVVRHVSFGRLHASDLDHHGQSTHVPAAQAGQLRVVCDAPMLVAFRVPHDERSGTAAVPVDAGLAYNEHQWFGLGRTSAGEKIGAYALHWALNASSDQGELQVVRSLDGGRSWTASRGSVPAEHEGVEHIGYARALDATTVPLAVRTLGVTLDAEIYIAPRHTLNFHDEVEADGLATFEIIY